MFVPMHRSNIVIRYLGHALLYRFADQRHPESIGTWTIPGAEQNSEEELPRETAIRAFETDVGFTPEGGRLHLAFAMPAWEKKTKTAGTFYCYEYICETKELRPETSPFPLFEPGEIVDQCVWWPFGTPPGERRDRPEYVSKLVELAVNFVMRSWRYLGVR